MLSDPLLCPNTGRTHQTTDAGGSRERYRRHTRHGHERDRETCHAHDEFDELRVEIARGVSVDWLPVGFYEAGESL